MIDWQTASTAILLAQAAIAAWIMRRREWNWVGAYVAFGCLFASVAKHEHWLRMLLDPEYGLGSPLDSKFFFWPPTLAWGLLACAFGLAILYAMVGALRRPDRLSTFALFPIALYQLTMAAWGIYSWILQGMAPPNSVYGLPMPAWLGVPAYLAISDLPFAVAIPFAIMRLFPGSGSAEVRRIVGRFKLTFGIVMVVIVILVAGVFAATLRTARMAGHGSATSQEFVAIALILITFLVLATLYDFQRRFLHPATRLLDMPAGQEPSADDFGVVWRSLARSIESDRAELAGYIERLESQYRMNEAVQTSAIDCIVTCDSSGLITGFNPAAEEAFGWTFEDIRGQSIGDTIIPERWREAHRHGFERAVANGRVANPGRRVELEGLRRDGTIFPVELTLASAPIDGQLHFIAYLRDLTTTREAEARINAAQALLRAFFDNAPAAMFLRDPEAHRFTMLNRSGESLLGMEGGAPPLVEGVAVHATAATATGDRHGFGELDERVRRSREPVTVEQTYALGDREVVGLATHFPVFDEHGAVVTIGGFVIDVTEARNIAAELERSRDALHQSEKLGALGQLLAGVAHELNNPLAIVVGRAAMLDEALAGSSHAASIEKLRAAADRCSRIVKTFLAMARQTGPRRSLVDVNELVEAAVDLTAYGLRSAGIETRLELTPGLPATHADGDQIVQVLINLIVNAQHAMEGVAGKHTLAISTALDRRKKALLVEVRDSGPGIPAPLVPRIFEPFFTTKDVGAGTGMGLPVSKGMIEAEGGALELLASSSAGACFRVTVPLRDAAAVLPEAAAEAAAPSAPAMRVLIVDDEPNLADMLAECLAPIGATCRIAASGAQALEIIAADRFDAILTDVRMPGMDGLELYERIAGQWPELAERLAFMSGDVLHSLTAQAARTIGRPVIEKPFDPEAIREVVRGLAKGQQQ